MTAAEMKAFMHAALIFHSQMFHESEKSSRAASPTPERDDLNGSAIRVGSTDPTRIADPRARQMHVLTIRI